MARFVDAYLPSAVPGYPCTSAPRFSTTLVTVSSGAEKANRNWQHPLWRYTLPDAVREWETVEALRKHWLAMGGPAQTFPFRDPLDFASVDLPIVPMQTTPTISMADQQIGTGNGTTLAFQLIKTYSPGAPAADYVRPIALPVLSSVLISVNGVDVSGTNPWTVSRPGGIVTFTTPPPPGQIVRAGFLFDVEVRFESDDNFAAVVQAYNAGGFADLTLVGVRSC